MRLKQTQTKANLDKGRGESDNQFPPFPPQYPVRLPGFDIGHGGEKSLEVLAFRPGGFGAEVVEGEQGRDLLARHRRTSVNKLIEEIAIIGIAEFDAETRFSTLAAKGSVQEGLALLDRAFEEVGREGEGAGK